MLPVNSAISAVTWYLKEVYNQEGRITVSLKEMISELENFLLHIKDIEIFKKYVREKFKVIYVDKNNDFIITSYQHFNTVRSFIKKLCDKAQIKFSEEYVKGVIQDLPPCSVNMDNILTLETIDSTSVKRYLSTSDVLVIKGVGRVGKTTLLKSLIDLYRKEGKFCLYITLTGTKAFEVQEGRTLAHVLKKDIPPAYSVILLDEASTVDLYSFISF
ncbi:MAG: AAA family ATPase [candidate division WOR-3 bacterium]